jgi:hypothetical protein
LSAATSKIAQFASLDAPFSKAQLRSVAAYCFEAGDSFLKAATASASWLKCKQPSRPRGADAGSINEA